VKALVTRREAFSANLYGCTRNIGTRAVLVKRTKTQKKKQNSNKLSSGLPAEEREQWLPLLSFLFFSFIMTPAKDHSHVSYPDCRRRLLSELPGLPPVPNLFPPPFRRVCLADILTNNEMNMQTTTQNRHTQTHCIPRGTMIFGARRKEKQRAAQHNTTQHNTTQYRMHEWIHNVAPVHRCTAQTNI